MRGFACVAALIVLSAGIAQADVPITSCGQSLEEGEVGVLQADIVCDVPTQTGVVIGKAATLRLNGHSISGGQYGLGCSRRCTIEGPGEVMGFSQAGVSSSNDRRIRVVIRDVEIHDNLYYGILLPWDARLVMTNVTVRDNNRGGVALGPPNSYGRVKSENVVISSNNGPAVQAKRIRLLDSTIEGNDGSGIYSINGGATLVDSTLTGNGVDFDPGYDLKTYKLPRLRNTTCGLSGRLLAGAVLDGTWGVCTND